MALITLTPPEGQSNPTKLAAILGHMGPVVTGLKMARTGTARFLETFGSDFSRGFDSIRPFLSEFHPMTSKGLNAALEAGARSSLANRGPLAEQIQLELRTDQVRNFDHNR